MTDSNYKEIESKIDNINNVTNLTERINMIKEIKETIAEEQEKIGNNINMILNMDNIIEPKKKKKSLDLNTLVESFNATELIEDKIKIYHNINYMINTIEKDLFSTI